jgi:hypothetical protein
MFVVIASAIYIGLEYESLRDYSGDCRPSKVRMLDNLYIVRVIFGVEFKVVYDAMLVKGDRNTVYKISHCLVCPSVTRIDQKIVML